MKNAENRLRVTVIIPTYRPDERFSALIERLQKQTLLPQQILVINTQQEDFREALIRKWDRVSVFHISKDEFDHGGTRDMAARMTDADVLVFMTMDAVPAGSHLLERLCAAFDDPKTVCAYARQLPAKDCRESERYTRNFSYGKESRVQSLEKLPVMGIHTYFCSDVCAAYRRDLYLQLGGFEKPAIFNEDMIFAARAVQKGYHVRYCADAQVIHSHNYSGLQQFHRNFDLGVSQADHPEIFETVKSESTGIRMVAGCARHLLKSGRWYELPGLIWNSGCKFLGYRMGRNYHRLPHWLIIRCTMNRQYWKKQEEAGRNQQDS